MKPSTKLLIAVYTLDGIIAWAYIIQRMPPSSYPQDQINDMKAIFLAVIWPVYVLGKIALSITAP